MKIKILLTGNDGSRHQFFKALLQQVTCEQAAASLNVVGTGTYRFKLEKDDIEILYVENHPLLKKNIKKYAIGVNAVILLDADQDTEEKIAAACPAIPVCKNTPGKQIDALNGVKLAVKKVYARQASLAENPQTIFHGSVTKKTESAAIANVVPQSQSVNYELLKEFLDKTPKRTYK